MFHQRNFVIVTFKDGTTMDSSGSCQGAAPHDLIEDLKWLGATLPSYIRDKGKTMLDVDTIQISIKYGQTDPMDKIRSMSGIPQELQGKESLVSEDSMRHAMKLLTERKKL